MYRNMDSKLKIYIMIHESFPSHEHFCDLFQNSGMRDREFMAFPKVHPVYLPFSVSDNMSCYFSLRCNNIKIVSYEIAFILEVKNVNVDCKTRERYYFATDIFKDVDVSLF